MGIEVRNLSKTYRRRRAVINAVNDISFTVETGSITGFIGANGAGKSTTIKMMTGILTPDAGAISIDGMTFEKNRKDIMRRIGVVFGQRSVLCWDIPIIETFRLFKDIYRIPTNIYKENLEAFSDILGIDKTIHKPPRQLSLGERMKADLAASLLYNPDVLFLDEPTIGIDVLSKEKIRNFIKKINKTRGTTIILTTHDMSDIEALCENMIILEKGAIRYDGTLCGLKSDAHTENLETIVKNIFAGEAV
ncbi:ABC transporter ATP-binding protein [Butyrivibrio sp. VCD2006]|uniref:ABC transporter ATP-binding protein n=1 Tax=Butyrivibrio sp. VCD2006 TaxID=1280664 RepID=UPI0003FBE0FA|nr:ATP-binding cassette domain-containing protein [Butyrivibrio sp. VCD2006]